MVEEGLLEDLSRRGACLSMNSPLALGAPVKLQAAGFKAEACVRYCRLGEYSFVVGLEFLPGFEWAASDWRPKHLLELSEAGEA